MNGRVYDPAIGRFLSPDPVVPDASFSQSWNPYSYALNSPLSYSDPSGLTFVAGCLPSLCGGGGRGGFAPTSVLATSSHVVRSVRYTLGLSFMPFMNFGFPVVNTPSPLMIYFSDPNQSGGMRRASSLESGRYRSSARFGSRFRLRVQGSVQTNGVVTTAAVDIGGDEQSPADVPIGLVSRVLNFFFPTANAQETAQLSFDEDLARAVGGGPGLLDSLRVEIRCTPVE